MSIIKTTGLCKSFGALKVLHDISLSIEEREIVAIVGASGAGKTTLLQILGTLMRADSGEIEIAGVDVCRLGDSRLADFRNRNIGFVFQFHHLLPEFTALENVMLPALIGGMSRREAEVRAQEMLNAVNVGSRMSHKPSEMSGGEQQRVAIARALVNRPAVLMADEPTGNLDTHNRDEICTLLSQVREQFNQTIIMVTHDMELASRADRKIQMSDGHII